MGTIGLPHGPSAEDEALLAEPGQPRLQTQDRLRVQLRDTRLGDAEHFADLAQGQLLVVVERDDELLALGEPRDRLADQLLELRLLVAARVRSVRVLDRVDERDRVPARGHRPQLVERGDRRPGDLAKALVELVLGETELPGDLLVGRRADEPRLQHADRSFDSRARARTERGTQSIERSSSMIAPLMREIA